MKKTLFVCRKCGLMLLLASLFMFAAAGKLSAQQISMTAKDPTLGQLIETVKKQSTYQFFHDSQLASSKLNSVDVKGVSLDALLKVALAGTGITYKIEDNICYLSAGQTAPSAKSGRIAVSGRVTDAKGLPIEGVAVTVDGTTTGVPTGTDGRYSIAVPLSTSTLTFASLGYDRQTVTVGSRSTIDISMREAAKEIDQVVVTALGIKRQQKALSYNAQQINQSEITTVKDANFMNSLSGKVAGMNIGTGSAGVGAATKVVMRGTKSISLSSNVLYVIDGMPMFSLDDDASIEFGSQGKTELIADINPEDIESITALTGAAGSALYGNNAANGVIMITTKKGAVGKTNLTVSSGMDFMTPFVLPDFQNRYGTGDPTATGGSSIKSWGALLNDANYMGYSPRSDYFVTGVTYNNSVSLSTGTERNQTYFSAAAINSNGVVPNNQYDRYNFTIRNTTSFLRDKMKLDLGGSYINQRDLNLVNQGVYSNPLTSAYLYPRGDDWSLTRVYERWNTSRDIPEQYWPQGEGDYRMQNPYWINYRNLRGNARDRFLVNVGLSYDVTDWLNLSGRAKIDYATNAYTSKMYATTNSTLAGPNGSYGITNRKDRQIYADAMANFKWSNDCWSLTGTVGASISDIYSDQLETTGAIRSSPQSLPSNVFNVLSLDPTKTQITPEGFREQNQAVFANVEVGYKGMYYLTASARNDWPSQLGGSPQQATGFFYPSVGFSAILSQIFDLPKQISFLKLRGSFASVGTPFKRGLAIPTYPFDRSAGTSSGEWLPTTWYPMGNLYPERTDSWEVGLNARLWQHISFDVSLYSAQTHNQTFQPQISVSSRYKTIWLQTGNVRNQGIEASLGYNNKWRNLSWNSNLTFSMNRNKILELVRNWTHPETGEVINKDRLDIGGLARARYILKTGGSMTDLYSIKDFKRDANGNIYVDADGNLQTVINGPDIKLGDTAPKANLAWRNDFNYKNFNLGFMFSARLGGVAFSATQAAMDLYGVSERSAAARDAGGVIINGSDLINAQTWYTTIGADSGMPQYYTYDATNVRLQELSFGYTFPRKMLKVLDLNISVVGRNLWMIYCKAPFDPETTAIQGNYYQGIDYFMMPALRNIGFNIRLKF